VTFVSTMLHQGGPTMFWILYLTGPALIVAILHAAMARGWSLIASLGAMALVLAIGLYGRHIGRELTDEYADRADREGDAQREAGYRESSRPLQLALIVSGLLVVPVAIGEIRRRRRAPA